MTHNDNISRSDVAQDVQAQAVTLLQVEQALRHLQGHLPVDSPPAGDLIQARLRCELLRRDLHRLSGNLLGSAYAAESDSHSQASSAA